MQKWEYKIVRMVVSARSELDQHNVAEHLNQLGRDGWELTGTVQDDLGVVAKLIFKRPISN